MLLLQVVFVDFMQSAFLKVFTNELDQVSPVRRAAHGRLAGTHMCWGTGLSGGCLLLCSVWQWQCCGSVLIGRCIICKPSSCKAFQSCACTLPPF